MKLSPTLIAAATAILCGLTSLYFASPVLRARVAEHSQRWFDWTEESRRADPIGFSSHVEQRLKTDLEKLTSTRLEMGTSVGDLNRKIAEYENFANQATVLAEEFRNVYQNAPANGGFPVTVRNASYTEAQVMDQVSLLLAEANGYNKTLAKMRGVQRQAGEKLEALAVRIDSTEAQLAMLSTQRELLRSRELTTDGERLVAQLDSLFDANTQAIAGNPVRNVRELLAASNQAPSEQPSLEAARQFLTAKVEVRKLPATDAATDATVEPKFDSALPVEEASSVPSIQQDVSVAEPAAKQDQVPVTKPAGKPIFSQF